MQHRAELEARPERTEVSEVRVPNAVHEAGPWAITGIAYDFDLLDVWALPARGDRGEFPRLLELATSLDPMQSESRAARVLWRARDRLGAWLGLGGIADEAAPAGLPIPGTDELSLSERLPEELRATTAGLDFGNVPFTPVYLTDVEFAAEISNRTVHGVLHLSWVDEGRDRHAGRLAVYVKPRGTLGRAYLAAIMPFRHLVVYPALLRQIGRAWEARTRT